MAALVAAAVIAGRVLAGSEGDERGGADNANAAGSDGVALPRNPPRVACDRFTDRTFDALRALRDE